GVPLGDVGRHVDAIATTEVELGLALPPSFREWIAFASDLKARKVFDRVFRDCYEVRDLDDLAAVSLMIRGEAGYNWAVKKEHLPLLDPPVFSYFLDNEFDADRFIEQGLFATDVDRFIEQGPSPRTSRASSSSTCFISFAGKAEGSGSGRMPPIRSGDDWP